MVGYIVWVKVSEKQNARKKSFTGFAGLCRQNGVQKPIA
jgi:hypothetical protein